MSAAVVTKPNSDGIIAGTVKDSLGGSVPNAFVVLRQVEVLHRNKLLTDIPIAVRKHPTIKTFTDSEGGFRVDHLEPGTYMVEVNAGGFSDFTQLPVVVEAGRVTSLNVTLEPVLEIPFERLELKGNGNPVPSCTDSTPIHLREVFTDPKSWQAFWAKYNIEAPSVDFQKYQVAAIFLGRMGNLSSVKVSRITYNYLRKHTVIHVAANVCALGPCLPVISCPVDIVLFPLKPGTTEFKMTNK